MVGSYPVYPQATTKIVRAANELALLLLKFVRGALELVWCCVRR